MKELVVDDRTLMLDDDMYEFYKDKEIKFDKDGYAYHKNKVLGMLHRNINDTPDGWTCDHRDHNLLNLQRSNLRNATIAQNSSNRKRMDGGSSSYKGVYKYTQTSKGKSYVYWWAKVKSEGKVVYRKSFKTEVEAARAYDVAAKAVHGEFAYLNFPDDSV